MSERIVREKEGILNPGWLIQAVSVVDSAPAGMDPRQRELKSAQNKARTGAPCFVALFKLEGLYVRGVSVELPSGELAVYVFVEPAPVVLVVERPLRGYVRDVSGPFRREDAFGAVAALLDVARVRAELGKLEDEA